MGNFTFRKRERLLSWPEFQNVLNRGKKRKLDSTCTVYWLENNLGWKRLGIITSKKLGNAVIRNTAKRKFREIFRRNKQRIIPTLDIVIVAGKESIDLPVATLEKKVMQALGTRV